MRLTYAIVEQSEVSVNTPDFILMSDDNRL